MTDISVITRYAPASATFPHWGRLRDAISLKFMHEIWSIQKILFLSRWKIKQYRKMMYKPSLPLRGKVSAKPTDEVF